MKHLKKLVTAMIVLAATVIACTSLVYAAGPIKILPWTQWLGDDEGDPHSPAGGYLDFTSPSTASWKGARIISVKSSRPKVLSVKKTSSGLTPGVRLIPHKIGRSKVTLTYRIGKKKYTTSAIYSVKEPEVFQWIKVNGKKIDLNENRDSYWVTRYRRQNVTVKFKARSGWKMNDRGCEVVNDPSAVRFRNGKTYPVKKPKTFINLWMKRGKYDMYFYGLAFTPNRSF